ncbi:MAG TPA: hypothetical protein VNL77_14315 [Roseiflexaceae bacterium]|nr:hypothetical protein [Roseiflexaceae bacterium]
MNFTVPNAELRTEMTAPTAAEVLDGMGLTTTLPERLIQDATGRAYEPLQIDQAGDLLSQLTLLLRREPVGGGEPLLRENARQVGELMAPQLNHALAGLTGAVRAFLHDLLREARARRDQIEASFALEDERYRTVHDRLRRWQERAGQRSGSLGGDLLRWLLGGPEALSLPEAAALWNEREYLALRRGALMAALDCFTTALDLLGGLLQNLDATIARGRQAAAALQRELHDLRQPPAVYAPWTLRIDAPLAAARLAAASDDEALVTALLRRLAAGETAVDLEAHLRALAAGEARRLLGASAISDLIALEAADAGPDADDPLVLIGQGLLEALQHPTWQLVRAARPLVETIQVTPDGAPVYALEGLTTAAYGGDAARLGFVQVQLGIAMDELLFLRDGDDAFQAMLRQRNLYVLDELAAWHDEPSSVPADDGAPSRLNGQEIETSAADYSTLR